MTKRPAETTPEKTIKSADEVELKRWRAQPPAEEKTFETREAKADEAPLSPKVDQPHAKTADTPLDPGKKHDHLVAAKPEAKTEKKRQDALIDEGLEETFPASDPVSVKHIT
jgi:hypothetical protein